MLRDGLGGEVAVAVERVELLPIVGEVAGGGGLGAVSYAGGLSLVAEVAEYARVVELQQPYAVCEVRRLHGAADFDNPHHRV